MPNSDRTVTAAPSPWASVAAEPLAAGGFAVALRGKPLKTPGGREMIVAEAALAEALAVEWRAQGARVHPDSMPMTQMAVTMLDRIAAQRGDIAAQIDSWLDTDLICYFAEGPPAVAQTQERLWRPWLDWFSDRFGASLDTTTGLCALRQPAQAHDAVARHVGALSDGGFTAAQLAIATTGSVVLGLALCSGALSPEQAFEAVQIEEAHHAALAREEVHGPAPHVAAARERLWQDLRSSARFAAFFRLPS